MKKDYTMGHFSYAVFFAITSLGSLGAGIVTGNMSMIQLTVLAVYYLVQTLCIRTLVKHQRISDRLYAVLQIVLLPVSYRALCFALDDTRPFLTILFVQTAVTLLFMEKKLCWIQNIVSLIWLFSMTIFHELWTASQRPTMAHYLTTALALCIITRLVNHLIDQIDFQTRQSREREQSLDDLSKVIEVKCEEARQATRSKSDFLSNMSHEIRTPIHAIIGMNEMILRESKDAQILEYATTVDNSSRILLSLINDILDFSKIESNKMEILPTEYQISSVLNDLLNMLQPKAQEKGLQLLTEISPQIPNDLYGDEIRIRQVLTNLLTNAIKYTDKGRVTICAEHKMTGENQLELCFTVTDTGRGIKKEDLDKLFHSFQRVDESKNRSIEGTGLGLAISYQLAKRMEGDITVESVYGVGSKFVFTLPQKQMRPEPIGDLGARFKQGLQEQKTYVERFHAPQARVLVVDDNVVNLKVIQNLLKRTQVQVETATSGAECLEQLKNRQYHILLLDHMMPEMDGLETLIQIREQHLDKNLPVIALTANAVSGAREMYMQNGFQDYLAKPVIGEKLEQMLCHWLPKELIRSVAEEATEPKTTDSPAAEREPKVSLLNHKTAMIYCANSEEMYLEILKCYVEESEESLMNLQEYYTAQNWKDYGILVHAIKSTSLTIGAESLSALAKEQELAAKQGDVQTVLAHHEELLKSYQQVLEEVKGLI